MSKLAPIVKYRENLIGLVGINQCQINQSNNYRAGNLVFFGGGSRLVIFISRYAA
jgi:hypothetical protein